MYKNVYTNYDMCYSVTTGFNPCHYRIQSYQNSINIYNNIILAIFNLVPSPFRISEREGRKGVGKNYYRFTQVLQFILTSQISTLKGVINLIVYVNKAVLHCRQSYHACLCHSS